MSNVFTRQELYDLVWSTPISKLAEKFNLSDRGMAKTCERHQIPVPGRGYWAKVEAGQPVKKTPLWKIDNPSLDRVQVGFLKLASNSYASLAIAAANEAVQAARARGEAATSKVHTSPIKQKAPKDPQTKEPFTLAPVRRYHGSIENLVAAIKAASPDEHGAVLVPPIHLHKDSRARFVVFLHHLAVALERRGIALTFKGDSLRASIHPESVGIEIGEERRREKHVRTPAEIKKDEDFDRRREIARRRGQWLSPENHWRQFDYHYSGKISFSIQNWADGARKQWKDGRSQTLESMLDNIADGVLFHLSYEKARRERREEEARRRAHLAHRRQLQKQRGEREEARKVFLDNLAEFQRESAQLRAVIAGAAIFQSDAEPEYVRMIRWAEGRLAYLESQNTLDVLTAKLREKNLFPDPDELHDPEGDPSPPRSVWDD